MATTTDQKTTTAATTTAATAAATPTGTAVAVTVTAPAATAAAATGAAATTATATTATATAAVGPQKGVLPPPPAVYPVLPRPADPSPALLVDAKTGERRWQYFAIGSMINHVSLSLRGLAPAASYPGVVHDWEILFLGEGGMATVLPQKGAYLHGVLHVVTEKEMAELDKMEGGYDHVDVTVHLYDGTTKPAIAYAFKGDRWGAMTKHNPPGERYIDIITRGCAHYGVHPAWIAYLESLPVQPRKQPSEFQKLPEPADPTAFLTRAEVAACDGTPGKDLMFVVNNKVLKWTQTDDAKALAGFNRKWLQENVGGKDATLWWARGLYEPRYPVATDVKTMHPDHKAWIEDMACGRMTVNMTVIAYVKDP